MSKLRFPNAHARKAVKIARANGWSVGYAGNGHMRFERDGVIVHYASSPRDPDNALRQTKRALLQPRKEQPCPTTLSSPQPARS